MAINIAAHTITWICMLKITYALTTKRTFIRTRTHTYAHTHTYTRTHVHTQTHTLNSWTRAWTCTALPAAVMDTVGRIWQQWQERQRCMRSLVQLRTCSQAAILRRGDVVGVGVKMVVVVGVVVEMVVVV